MIMAWTVGTVVQTPLYQPHGQGMWWTYSVSTAAVTAVFAGLIRIRGLFQTGQEQTRVPTIRGGTLHISTGLAFVGRAPDVLNEAIVHSG